MLINMTDLSLGISLRRLQNQHINKKQSNFGTTTNPVAGPVVYYVGRCGNSKQ